MNFREVRGKTLHRLTLNVRRWREKGYETVGGVFKTADGYAVIMSRAGGASPFRFTKPKTFTIF